MSINNNNKAPFGKFMSQTASSLRTELNCVDPILLAKPALNVQFQNNLGSTNNVLVSSM